MGVVGARVDNRSASHSCASQDGLSRSLDHVRHRSVQVLGNSVYVLGLKPAKLLGVCQNSAGHGQVARACVIASGLIALVVAQLLCVAADPPTGDIYAVYQDGQVQRLTLRAGICTWHDVLTGAPIIPSTHALAILP